jgi:hypothetical protein
MYAKGINPTLTGSTPGLSTTGIILQFLKIVNMQINVKMLETALGVKTRKARNLTMFNVKQLTSEGLKILLSLTEGDNACEIHIKRSGTGLVVILSPQV